MDADTTEATAALVRAWTPERRREAGLRILRRPQLFDIEAASACNIVCSFCPREAMERPMRLMDEATFERIAGFLPDDAVVMFSGLGDALLNPRTESFVSRLKRRGISSCLVTNGIRLDPERQRSLAAAGLDQLQVSVHGLDDSALASIVTRGSDPDRVRRNLEHLSRARSPALRVRLNFVETLENAHARGEVERFARELGFDFYFRRLHGRGGTVTSPRAAACPSGCGIFAAVTFITVEGQVLSCVNDVRGESALGNAGALDWPALAARKRDVLQRDAWFSFCRGCDDDYRWVILAQGGVDEPGPARPGEAAR